jgi:hypothetical protein
MARMRAFLVSTGRGLPRVGQNTSQSGAAARNIRPVARY